MLAGVTATLAAFAIARRLAGNPAGLIAGAWGDLGNADLDDGSDDGGRDRDGARVVRGLGRARVPRRSPPVAASSRVRVRAALAVKSLLLPAALPVGCGCGRGRRVDHLAIAIGAAMVLGWRGAAVGTRQRLAPVVKYNAARTRGTAKLDQLDKLRPPWKPGPVGGSARSCSPDHGARGVARERRRTADVVVLRRVRS